MQSKRYLRTPIRIFVKFRLFVLNFCHIILQESLNSRPENHKGMKQNYYESPSVDIIAIEGSGMFATTNSINLLNSPESDDDSQLENGIWDL